MQSALSPTNATEVVDALQWALSAKEPLEVIGGGTKRAIANPSQTGHSLDMSRCTGIVSYEPEELVLSVAPGTSMVELSQALEGAGQMLAFEPPDYGPLLGSDGTATFGGTFATNFAGPRRISAGAVRDHMLGLSAVSGRGEAFKAGGRVVKNVTGYDLARALAGSWGTLAVATELTVKVLPRPQEETTLLLHNLSAQQAVVAMSRAMGSSCDISGAAHLPADIAAAVLERDGGAVTALRIEGFGPSVAARTTAAVALMGGIETLTLPTEPSRALWAAVRDGTPFVGSTGVVWRCSVPPTAGPSVAQAAPQGARSYLDWAGGLVMIQTPDGDSGAEAIRGAVADCGGHALMLRAPVDIRAETPTFHPMSAGVAALSARLRTAFDPHGILNPNRMARESA
ncbi:MAG: glycolate oxidase subunit GlcE [Pseudomonadota bacterium]